MLKRAYQLKIQETIKKKALTRIQFLLKFRCFLKIFGLYLKIAPAILCHLQSSQYALT